jgi:hypothetical protein
MHRVCPWLACAALLLYSCDSSTPSNNPGDPALVSIVFSQPSYTFTSAQATAGITIPYDIAISRDVDTVYAIPLATCVEPDSTGLIPLERIAGNDQNYCRCDNGLCFSPESYVSRLQSGTYPRQFVWDGRNWYGFSDTGNPEGALFPAGEYWLSVTVRFSTTDGRTLLVADSLRVVLTD